MELKKANNGVERAVLAGLCQHGKVSYYDVADIISANSFTINTNQCIYKCIESIYKESNTCDQASILAMSETLNLQNLVSRDKNSLEFINSLFVFPIQSQNVRGFAKQLAKLELIRKSQSLLIDSFQKLDEFDGTESVDDILGVSEETVFGLTNELITGDTVPEQFGEGLDERLQHRIDNPVDNPGIPTPWPIYNRIIGGGLRPGVTLICARPKIGKSTLAINCGLHVSDVLKIPVLYIDTEMNRKEQEDRILANMAQIDIDFIETGKLSKEHQKKIFQDIKHLKTIKWKHKWVGGKSFEEIMSIVRRWIYTDVGFDSNGNTNPHLLVYDYFKLMDSSELSKMQEYQAIGFQISYLSDFCKKYQTPCLSFAQVNRDGITKDTSDIISQSDRLLWLCISATVYKKKEQEEVLEDGTENGNRKMILLDGRFAKPLDFGDYINFSFTGETSSIKELTTKSQALKKQQTGVMGFEEENIELTNDENDVLF